MTYPIMASVPLIKLVNGAMAFITSVIFSKYIDRVGSTPYNYGDVNWFSARYYACRWGQMMGGGGVGERSNVYASWPASCGAESKKQMSAPCVRLSARCVGTGGCGIKQNCILASKQTVSPSGSVFIRECVHNVFCEKES